MVMAPLAVMAPLLSTDSVGRPCGAMAAGDDADRRATFSDRPRSRDDYSGRRWVRNMGSRRGGSPEIVCTLGGRRSAGGAGGHALDHFHPPGRRTGAVRIAFLARFLAAPGLNARASGRNGRGTLRDYSPAERSSGGGGGTYCVRLCDGRYYPIPRSASGQFSPAKMCSAMCPAAQTQVFNGNPEHAVAADGTHYADLTTAFAYRQHIVPDCSCTGHGTGGLAPLDVDSDPTLRAGDVVAGKDNLTVFKGAGQLPYKPEDFAVLDGNSKGHADLSRRLADVKVDPTAVAITPVQTLATEEAPAQVSRPRPRRPRETATENRRPPNFFDIFR